MKDNKEKDSRLEQEEVDRFPGVALDAADKDEVKPTLEAERTKTLDNNPRDNN